MEIGSIVVAFVGALVGWILRHHGFAKDTTLFGAGVQHTLEDVANAAAGQVAADLAKPSHPVQVVLKDAVAASVKAAVADMEKGASA